VSRTHSILIAHREKLAAEGIAFALGRFPGILPVAVATTAGEAEINGRGLDAVALDGNLPEAEKVSARLRSHGVRVVLIASEAPADESAWVSPSASTSALADALVPGMRDPRSLQSSLSRRERQVLDLVAQGLVGKQVARELGISPKTVEQHKSRIFAKLGVPNQTAAVSVVMAGSTGGS
jgi:DNA-binding CsgD family transcriptional regulator